MTFPTIPTVAAGRVLFTNQADAVATRTFPSLSSLTKNAGDRIIAIIVTYQSTGNPQFSAWGAGFTEISDQGSSSTLGVGVAELISTGSETGTFTVTQAGTITGHASMCLLSIPGAHASTASEVGTIANGTSSAADPGSFNPAGWDSEDTLWIAVDGNGMTSGTGSWTACGAGTLSNYSDLANSNTSDSSTVGQTEIAVSFRQLAAASEDRGAISTHDTSNARNSALIIAVRPAPSVQTLTPSLFTDGQTFHAATVTPGAVALTPSLFTDDDTFYAATVSSTYALTPALFTDDDTFHNATVTPGAINLAPALYTDGDTFYSPEVSGSGGAQDLTPELFTGGDTFHAATVSATYSLTPSLFSTDQTFYAPTAAATYALTPALFTDGQTFYAATVGAAYALTPSLFTSGQTFYSPTVTPGAVTLTPALFSNAEAFYAPTVSAAYGLAPDLLTDGDTFYAATVVPGAVTLTPGWMTNAQVFYAATVTGGDVPVDYTRAPAGAGYQRPALHITRPASTDTTRRGSSPTRRPASTETRRP